MKVDHKNKIYNKWSPLWTKTRDAFGGEDKLKSKSTVYLRKLKGQDEKSYEQYLDRARYANFTARTVDVALGQLYRKPPVIIGIPDEARENISLNGRSIYYFSKEISSEILLTNRVGILVDYSEDQGRTYLTQYKAEEIINWKTEVINGIKQLSLVVLEGIVDVSEDTFAEKEETVWRVLQLDEGIYYVRDYRKKATMGREEFVLVSEYVPKMDGRPLDFIPFYLVTSNGITVEISKAPLLDLVNVNLGHYKNSADYENMLHWTGAKTFIVKGWDDNQVFPVGGCANVSIDGDAYLLEASSDSGLLEELRHKEEQMSAMGTSLISGKGRYVQSAETSRITSQGEYASLADISNALSDSMTIIASVMAFWDGAQEEEIVIEYNKDFELSEIDPRTFEVFMGSVQSGYMSWDTFFYNMQSKELYPDGWTITDELEAIEKTQKALIIRDETEDTMEEEDIEDEELTEDDA